MKKSIFILVLFLICICCSTNGKLIAPVKFDGKYGFIDNKGKWFIKPIFDSVGIFYNGYADVYKNGKNGLINSKGKIIIDYKYDFIGNKEGDIVFITLNNGINFINLKDQLISKTYFYDADDFNNGLAPVKFHDGGKWGFINEKGELKIDTLYNYAGSFENGNAEVEMKDSTYFINTKGKIIHFKQTEITKNKKFALIGNSNSGTLGMVNQGGDTIMKKKYIAFGYKQNEKFWFNENGKYGLANTSGAILIKPEYEYLSNFSDIGLAVAKRNNKYGFIDDSGSVIIEFKFDKAENFKHGLAAVMTNGKWGFINSKGNLVIQPIFEKITHQFRPVKAKFEPMYKYSD